MDRHPKSEVPGGADEPREDRRGFLARISSLGMLAGLAASYGTAGAFGARYLYPARPRAKAWMFVARVADLRLGASIEYSTPGGERVAIARQGESGELSDFVALSSTCPHLGCQVHWEAANDRFFCPCHTGTFDKDGVGTGGPPGDAGQSLPRYPLEIREGLLYIEVPIDRVDLALGPPPERDEHGPFPGESA